MAERLEREVQLLNQYEEDVHSIIEELIKSDTKDKQRLQEEMEFSFMMFRRQIDFLQGQFPEAGEGRRYEASYLTAQAKAKVVSAGLMQRLPDVAQDLTAGIATGQIAEQQENNATREAIGLIYEAIRLWDHAGPRLLKARLLYIALDQKENALQELDFIIAKFQQDKDYIKARQLRDAIENSR